MNEKRINQIAFVLTLITMEAISYGVTLIGVGVVSFALLKNIYLKPSMMMSFLICLVKTWELYLRGFYHRKYRINVLGEEAPDDG